MFTQPPYPWGYYPPMSGFPMPPPPGGQVSGNPIKEARRWRKYFQDLEKVAEEAKKKDKKPETKPMSFETALIISSIVGPLIGLGYAAIVVWFLKYAGILH